MAERPCPQCGVPMFVRYLEPTVPTYPVYSNVPDVATWYCPRCASRTVAATGGVAMPDPNDLSPAEVGQLRDEMAALRSALGSAEADLSLLRFRAEQRIPWGKGGVPMKHEVEETITKARKALGYR